MDGKQIDRLEKELEEAIADAIGRIKNLPVEANRHTVHLMAKAAATVYEAVSESGS